MTTFVDTTAFFALVDPDDRHHGRAAEWITGPGRDPRETLVTHNYVVIEATALVESRLGAKAVRLFVDAYLPAVSILFVDEQLHRRAVSGYLAGLGRASLTDRTSFEMMRDLEIQRAFCFDRDFAREGFQLVP